MDTPEIQHDIPATAPHYRNEPALRAAVAATLRAHGVPVEEQVACATGAADIVTSRRDAVIEVKLDLTRKHIQAAVGQALLYRQAINPEARAIVLGYATEETATLRPYVEALGIELVSWRDEMGVASWGLEVEEQVFPAISMPLSPTLCWRVAEYAQSRRILSVRELSFRAHINRQSLHPIWHGRAKNISLVMLGRLCQTLGADPGGWFRWEGDELIWNIREAAETQGMSMQDLAWTAEILPLTPIWRAEQQFVFVQTLQKLAQALNLNIGDLFVWQERAGFSDAG